METVRSNPTDVELYDRAVVSYLKEIEKKVVFSPTDLAEYTITKKYNVPEDMVPYPFISVYRDPDIPIDWSRYSNHTVRSEFTRLSSTPEGLRTAQYVHSIPVTLTYQADLWGIKATDILRLSEALLLKLTVTNPILYVPINPDGKNGRFCIENVNWVDNSDIESETSKGRLYRHTFVFTIDARIKLVKNIETSQFKAPSVHVNDEESIYDF